MTDLSGVIRWNANFVRGLAQSVLDRARVIRSSLAPYSNAPNLPRSAAPEKAATSKASKKPVVKPAKARSKTAKASKTARSTARTPKRRKTT